MLDARLLAAPALGGQVPPNRASADHYWPQHPTVRRLLSLYEGPTRCWTNQEPL